MVDRGEMTKWLLVHGYWNGVVESKSIAQGESHENREDAVDSLQKHSDLYQQIGYRIWWASLRLPNGDIEHLKEME